MYHGTANGGFHVFNTYGSNYGLFGQGSCFTDGQEVGQSYTKKGKGSNPKVYEVYLNIKNPMDMDAPADAAAWREAFPDVDFPASGTKEQFYRAMEEYFQMRHRNDSMRMPARIRVLMWWKKCNPSAYC